MKREICSHPREEMPKAWTLQTSTEVFFQLIHNIQRTILAIFLPEAVMHMVVLMSSTLECRGHTYFLNCLTTATNISPISISCYINLKLVTTVPGFQNLCTIFLELPDHLCLPCFYGKIPDQHIYERVFTIAKQLMEPSYAVLLRNLQWYKSPHSLSNMLTIIPH